jgi:hypothetical protein
MAVTNFTPLLGLALPTTGDLNGTWGTTVNNAITSLLDSAVAGTTTLSVDADVTLTTTNGSTNQARNAIILWTANNGATTRYITAPAQSKAYVVINAGTGSIVIRGSGPTTGITIPSGTKALVAWNGSDFVKIVSNPVVLTTDVSGTLPIANGGTGTTSTTFANLATNVTGTLPVANGGTGTTTPSLVAGTNVTISGSWPNQTINSTGGGSGSGTVTSVGMTVPSFLSVAGSPITTSGTLAVGLSGSALPVVNGGTGTTTPSLVAGSNISITGSWPNQTIATTGSGAILTTVTFTSSTTFTVPTGVTSILCEVIGGGGGAAVADATASGGGGFAYGSIAVSAGQVLTITVGAGGVGNQSYGSTGTNGGTSEIVRGGTSLMSATGSAGSGIYAQNTPGGSASNGSIYNINGMAGGFGAVAGPSGGVPGSSGRGFPTARLLQNGPGAGGYSYGNTYGTNGLAGQITLQYVV